MDLGLLMNDERVDDLSDGWTTDGQLGAFDTWPTSLPFAVGDIAPQANNE